MILEAIRRLCEGANLSDSILNPAVQEIIDGSATPAHRSQNERRNCG